MRAEIYATDRLYKQLINNRIDEALDDYISDMMMDNSTSNTTLVDVFTQVQEHVNQITSTTLASQQRTRRTPTIGLTGMNVANTANSFSTGHAPLAWLGEALGYLLGIPTKNSVEFRQIAKNARAIEALSINQHILAQTVNLFDNKLTVCAKMC